MMLHLAIQKHIRNRRRDFQLDVQIECEARNLVIMGASGSGKTLTLQAICGLLTPDRGHIVLEGEPLFDSAKEINLSPQQRHLAYVFQDYALFPHLNVRQNIAFSAFPHWRNPPKNVAFAELDYWLEAFDLKEVAAQYPVELSGGQRQRTALARALISHPRALLLDEPFSALDADLRQKMRLHLQQLIQEHAIPLILISHDREDAEFFSEQTFTLAQGKVVAQERK